MAYYYLTLGGQIYQDSANPIVVFRTNSGAWGSYMFYLKLSTWILSNSDGYIVVRFPQNYRTTNGGKLDAVKLPSQSQPDPCPIAIYLSSKVFCPSSSQISFVGETNVYLSLEDVALSAGSLKIEIKYVLNPNN